MPAQKFNKPSVGSVVTVTTRFPETHYHATNKWRDNTYQNVKVLEPEKWFTADEFKVTSDDPKVPVRVINLKNVVDIQGDVTTAEHDQDNFTVTVQGSKGKQYEVTFIEGTPTSCTCPGFVYRNRCRHLAEATNLVDQGSQNQDNAERVIEPLDNVLSQRGNDTMSNSKALSWNDRFALIDHYQPTDEQIRQAFGVKQNELDAARGMRETNSFTPSEDIDLEAYRSLFEDTATSTTNTGGATSTTKPSNKTAGESQTSTSTKNPSSDKKGGEQQSATKPSTATSQKKPGRRSNKIATAFGAIPTTPTSAEQFAKDNNVSVTVLRQSKRFDKYPEMGAVKVKKDKDSGELLIWREQASAES